MTDNSSTPVYPDEDANATTTLLACPRFRCRVAAGRLLDSITTLIRAFQSTEMELEGEVDRLRGAVRDLSSSASTRERSRSPMRMRPQQSLVFVVVRAGSGGGCIGLYNNIFHYQRAISSSDFSRPEDRPDPQAVSRSFTSEAAARSYWNRVYPGRPIPYVAWDESPDTEQESR